MTSIPSCRNELAVQEAQQGVPVGMLPGARAQPQPLPCCCTDASQGKHAVVQAPGAHSFIAVSLTHQCHCSPES